jgi:PAS domain S-box-containing protein
MRQLPTDQRLHKFSVALTIIILVVSGAIFGARNLGLDHPLPFANAITAVSTPAATAFFILAVALLGHQLHNRFWAWLAIIPTAMGLVRVACPVNASDAAILQTTRHSLALCAVHFVAGLCILFSSTAVAWLARKSATASRTLFIAFVASVLGSVGFSSLLGYELELPAVYRWGTSDNLPPGTAGQLFLLGVVLFVVAWREQQRVKPGAPVWLPMPFVIGTATLSSILWLGLREVENVRIATSTEIVLRDFATAIDRELQQGETTVEQLARLVAQEPSESNELWSANVRAVKNEVLGVQAFYRLSRNFRVISIEPAADLESFRTADQGANPIRRSALLSARDRHHAHTSGTVENPNGLPGVAIYAPILIGNTVAGYTGVEISYRELFAAIERTLKIAGNYYTTIAVNDRTVFEDGGSKAGADRIQDVFEVADRRIRIAITPTRQTLRASRGYLPELALGAGWGITLLLGLSVHLARSARSSLRSAQLSNAKLVQENEERRRVEEQLRVSQASARKLSLVASKTDNLVLIANADGLVEWVNESFETTMGYTLAEIAGRNPVDFMVGPDTDRRTVNRIKAALRRGKSVSTDLANYSKSGERFYLHLEVQPVFNEQGRLENFIAVEFDITARVDMEKNLRRAKVEADAASRAKSEFLASMSHEIRTPMNGVIGMTSLLLDSGLNAEQRDYVNTIRNSGDALLTIINEILDFSKIESGNMELEQLPFELAVCVEDCLDLFSVQASKHGLELVYLIDADVPGWIQGDVTRLRQVLVNLVNNAVKFTPSGSVSIRVRCPEGPPTGRPGEKVAVEFSVIDTGIGIPPDRVDRLFRPFSQVDSSTTRRYGGTGLGLVISQRLCQLMGGTIQVDTTVEQGATFRFTIRVEPVNTPSGWGLPQLPTRLGLGDTLGIIAHPITRQRLDQFLKDWGARPHLVDTPAAAMKYLQTSLPTALIFDYSLVDQPLGHELRTHLSRGETPLILLLPTGESAEDLSAFAGRRGVATVPKPVRTNALVRNLQNLFDAPPDSLPPFVVPADTHLLGHEIPLDILLVEDNAVNQKVALRFLDRLGYRADAVANGIEAVNTLRHRKYHLVLMDLQMPEMDGFAASREIRRIVPLEHQPKIIALTANALQGDREQCLAAGMDDYITKPVKLLDIAQVIRRQFPTGTRPPMA